MADNMVNAGVEKFTKLFSSPTEKFICSLGNSYLENFLANGTLSRGFSVLSDKRVYFNGTCYTRSSGGKFSKTSETRIVDVKDVTGTGFVQFNPVWMIIVAFINFVFWAMMLFMTDTVFGMAGPAPVYTASGMETDYTMQIIMLTLMVAPTIVLLVAAILNRRTLFEISFAGGGIAFNTAWLDKAEIETFQRNIRLAKDAYDERAEVQHADLIAAAVKAPVSIAPSSNVADELKKYKDLLDSGVLNQEEFDEAKAKLLGKL